MGFFNLDWLTGKERKEFQKKVDQLESANRVLIMENETLVAEKPYKRIYYSDSNITVVFMDGTTAVKSGVDKPTYQRIKGAETEEEILDILNPPRAKESESVEIETTEERQLVLQNSAVLAENDDFEVRNNEIYLKGVSLALPAIVAASFIEVLERLSFVKLNPSNPQYMFEEGVITTQADLEDQYHALKMFWLKLALNGIEQSRLDLLNFVRKNNVKITINGNLVLYRRIVSTKEGNKAYIEFVSQQYSKVKGWKKSPKNYYVFLNEDNEYELHETMDLQNHDQEDYAGTLYDCYAGLPDFDDNEYTSSHNRGKHIIKIGQVYAIDEKGINLNNGLCAAGGLHAAAVDYNYSGFGDTPVVVLVNPSKAITVPVYETGKLRTTEMFIAAINDKPHGTHFDEGALSAFDEEYNNISIAELENAVATKSFAPATVVDEVSPITFADLESIKNMLKERVTHI